MRHILVYLIERHFIADEMIDDIQMMFENKHEKACCYNRRCDHKINLEVYQSFVAS